jgi:spore photoproduct lyase
MQAAICIDRGRLPVRHSRMRTMDDIRVIVYDRDDRDNPIARRFLAIPGKEHVACGGGDGMDEAALSLGRRGLASKEVLLLKPFLGRMHQKCPGSQGMICCNYRLVNIGFNCLYNCTYCYLNYYLNSYGIIQFIRPLPSLAELDGELRTNPGTIYRVGTGEFTDSLMLDEISGIGEALIAEAARYPNLFLEFKTKSDNISHLLGIREKGNTVLAWTLNTERAISLYEAGSAPLDERIRAAAGAARAGYLNAFHFDPMIEYDGWIEDYGAVVDALFRAVDPARVAWISMGCFRYSHGFKEIVRSAFPGERLTVAEMFPGLDGKYRYIRQRRVMAYRELLDRIRSYSERPFVYLCMESSDVWDAVFGTAYRSSDELEAAFGAHLKKLFT